MSFKSDRKYFELYCCLQHELYPDYPKETKKKKHRNTNALSTRLMKCKTDQDQYENETKTFRRIMSIDTYDYQRSSQMADGDKNHRQIFEDRSTEKSLKFSSEMVPVNRPIMLSPDDKQQDRFPTQSNQTNSCISTNCSSIDSTENSKTLQSVTEIVSSVKFPSISPSINTIEKQQPKQVRSLSESIDDLCLLIRKFLNYEMTEQDGTSLQTAIASQLAILLTYLTVQNNEKIVSDVSTKKTMEKMTSTIIFSSNVETQTDFDWKIELNPDFNDDLIVHETSMNQSLSLRNTTSHTELATLHLPGYRPHHALSDTFVYHIRHHYQHSSSCHQLTSHSAMTIQMKPIKQNPFQLVRYLREQFQYFIELESSNTCLEASTEFTPDFLLTTINSSKHDQTEQFGIDTLAVNSNEKENYDSLEQNTIDFHQYRNDESIFDDDDLFKSSITEISSLISMSPISESIRDNYLSNQIDFCQLLSPILNSCQWQTPILLRKANSFDFLFEKHSAKMEFKQLKVRSNSNNEINLIGKRVRINSYLDEQQERNISSLNFNNNCLDWNDSIDSLQYSNQLFTDSDDEISNEKLVLYLFDMNKTWNSTMTFLVHDHIRILHMYIRQFLIEFDRRLRIARKRKAVDKLHLLNNYHRTNRIDNE